MPVWCLMLFDYRKKYLSPAMNSGTRPRRPSEPGRYVELDVARFRLMSAETTMFWMPSLPHIRATLRRARSVTMPQS